MARHEFPELRKELRVATSNLLEMLTVQAEAEDLYSQTHQWLSKIKPATEPGMSFDRDLDVEVSFSHQYKHIPEEDVPLYGLWKVIRRRNASDGIYFDRKSILTISHDPETFPGIAIADGFGGTTKMTIKKDGSIDSVVRSLTDDNYVKQFRNPLEYRPIADDYRLAIAQLQTGQITASAN